jgi:hypothetical protein
MKIDETRIFRPQRFGQLGQNIKISESDFPRQHPVGNFFNNGGALPPAFVSLFNLTGSNLTNALDQLSGEAATSAQKVAFQLTDQFLDLMLDPFVDGRCGIGRTDHPPLGFAGDCETRPSALGFAPERETLSWQIIATMKRISKSQSWRLLNRY